MSVLSHRQECLSRIMQTLTEAQGTRRLAPSFMLPSHQVEDQRVLLAAAAHSAPCQREVCARWEQARLRAKKIQQCTER